MQEKVRLQSLATRVLSPLVIAALVVGGIYILSRCEVVRSIILFSYEQNNWQRVSLDIENIASLAELDVDKEYHISVSGIGLSMSSLVPLTRLRGVRSLTLSSFPQLGGGFLRSLASFQSLRHLWLIDVPLDDHIMLAIRDMTDLCNLSLRSDEGDRRLSNLELLLPLAKVESLGLTGWRLTADNGKVVGSLSNIRNLRLYVNDNVPEFLSGIPRGNGIEVLDLGDYVEPRSFPVLIEWEHLRVVILASADEGEFARTATELRRRGVKVVTDT